MKKIIGMTLALGFVSASQAALVAHCERTTYPGGGTTQTENFNLEPLDPSHSYTQIFARSRTADGLEIEAGWGDYTNGIGDGVRLTAHSQGPGPGVAVTTALPRSLFLKGAPLVLGFLYDTAWIKCFVQVQK